MSDQICLTEVMSCDHIRHITSEEFSITQFNIYQQWITIKTGWKKNRKCEMNLF